MYLIIDRAKKRVFEIKIWLPDNTRSSKSSSRFSSKKFDLEKVELGEFNIKLGL